MFSLSAIFSDVPSPFSFTLSKRVSRAILHGIGAVLAGVVLYDVYADWMLEGKPLWSTLLENALPLILALALPVGSWQLSRTERAKEYLSSAAKWVVVGCMGTLVVAGLALGFQIVQREMKPLVFIGQVMTAGALAGLLAGCILVEVRRRREQSRWQGRDGAPPEEAVVQPVPFGRMRLSKQVALGVLMAVGIGLAGVVLFDVYQDWMSEGKPLWSTLAENAVPLLLALMVPVTGWNLARSTEGEVYLSAAAKWTFAGAVGMLVIAGSVVGLQIIQGELKPGVILTQMSTFGAVAGLFVGYSIARARRVRGALTSEKARLRALAHSVPGGLAQFEVRPEGTTPEEKCEFVFVSDHTEELLGLTPTPDDYLRRLVEQVATPHRDDMLAALGEAMAQEVQWDFEVPVDRPGGERVWVRGIFTPKHQRAPGGETTLVYHGVTIDVTDRKEAERRYEAIFNHTFQFTGLMRPDGTLVEANDTALEVGGLTEEEVLGKPMWETYWFQTGEGAPERLRDAVRRAAEGEFVRYEETIRSEQGPQVIDISIRPLTDEEGEVRMLVPEGRDITERKRREQELERSQERWQRLVESMEDGLHVTVDGDIRYINPAGAAILGAESPEDVIGTPLHTFLTNTDQRRKTLEARLAKLARGEPTEPHRWEIQSLDGERRVIESYSIPIEFEGTQAAQTIMRDVTEQERRKRQRERQNDLFRKTQEMANVGAWEYDVVADRLTWTSQVYEIHGVSEEAFEPTPERAFSFYHPDDRPTIQEGFERAIEEKEGYDVEVRIETPEGKTQWVRARGEPQTDVEGTVERVRGTFQDITPRKRREEALQQAKEEAEEASDLKSALLANMSHEFRTPLTSIIGLASTIEDELEDEDGLVPTFASRIQVSGKRLMDTLKGVIHLARFQSGMVDLSSEPTDVSEKAHTITQQMRPEAEEKEIHLKTELPEDSLLARADEEALEIALRNLVSNAVKFTGSGGTVALRADQTNGTVVLEVEDTGIGMNPAEVEGLFEAFQQASTGVAREYEGSGLGLTVTRHVVQEMNGTIDVKTSPEEGSRFTIRLPGGGAGDG